MVLCVGLFFECLLCRLSCVYRRGRDQPAVLGSVIRATGAAFHAQHVEGDSGTSLAVIAYDPDCSVLVLCGHGSLGNFLISLFPELLHVEGRMHTQRTAVSTSSEHVLKACFV